MPRVAASRTSSFVGAEPRVRVVVVGAHRPAEHEHRGVLREVGRQVVAGVRPPDVEVEPRLDEPPSDQRRGAVVLVLDDEDR